ncbi:MAG: hypothetical protein IT536_03355 [Hyphomicrobiales bacterium]|nr:hypothetical protein [Hyphomicrobiales bacterium]
MSTSAIIKTTTVALAASLAFAGHGEARGNCTPQHLLSTLRKIEAQCGRARVVSGYRPGATIRGTGRISQHAFCNGTNGAIDAMFGNRACAVAALRKTGYMVLTYGGSGHIHFGTDGWGNRRGSRFAQRQVHRRGARVAQHQPSRASAQYWPRVPDSWNDSNTMTW